MVKPGVWLPVVAVHPRFPTPDGERAAGAGELAPIARAADESAGHYSDQLAALAALASGEDR